MTLTRVGTLLFAVTGVVGLLLGALVGASLTMAWMFDQARDCEKLRADAYETQAKALDAALQTKIVIEDFLCAKRGVCK